MSLAKASLWTAASTLVKIGAGLLVVKLLAVSFGPAGVGQAGNFRQMVTVLGVLAGAGIFNGVTKYVAQHHDDPTRLRTVVGTSSAMVLGFSTLMAVIFLLAAAPISQGLFGHTHYQGLVRLVALVQMGIAWANLLLALMKGFRDAAGNALSLIVGSLVGVVAYYGCYRLGGYEGALLGLALVPALVVIPAAIMLIKRGTIPLHYLKPSWVCIYALKRIPDQLNLLSQDAHHVEPAGAVLPQSVAVHVVHSRFPDAVLLPPVHCLKGTSHAAVPTVFHFHKYQAGGLAANQVHLPLDASVIPLQDFVAFVL